MSKCQILFDDNKSTCQSHLHQQTMTVCIKQGCYAVPVVSCLDCVGTLHHKGDTMERSQFVEETNRKYQNIQNQAFALEGEYKLFENKGAQVKKLFNGEIERIKIQLTRQMDDLREQVGAILDGILLNTKKETLYKVHCVQENLVKVKARNISQLSNDQLRQLIQNVWHHDYELNADKLRQFYNPLQHQIKEHLSQLLNETSSIIQDISVQLIDTVRSLSKENEDKDKSQESIMSRLLKERDNIVQQLHQHLASKNCTHKGCHRVEQVKAYYGYYYNISGYSTLCELPISVCAKSRKLSQRMHEIVNRLYTLKYRDHSVDDYVTAHFIY